MADQPRRNGNGARQLSASKAARLEREQFRKRKARKQRVVLVAVILTILVLGASAYGIAHRGGSKVVAADTPNRTSVDSSAPADASAASSPATATASQEATLSTVALRTYPTEGQRTIVVYRAEQHVVLFDESGAEVADYLCSTGRVDPVPGTYHVTSHKPTSAWGDKHFQYFTIFTKTAKGNNIGFHAIPRDSKGNEVGKSELGKAVSAGCVRLEAENAKFLYDWAVNGTRIVVVK